LRSIECVFVFSDVNVEDKPLGRITFQVRREIFSKKKD